MARKPVIKNAVIAYIKANPEATNEEICNACNVKPAYLSKIKLYGMVKKRKRVVTTGASKEVTKEAAEKLVESMTFNNRLIQRINDLTDQVINLQEDIVRLCGVIDYLESKLKDATSV
jgi:methylphosphotriester-DNA--protein-cysteine methyltransferase